MRRRFTDQTLARSADTSGDYLAHAIRCWNGMLVGVVIVMVVTVMISYRQEQAPDLFSDEGLYGSISANLANGRGLVENSGKLFIWHPPLYPLIGAGYLWGMGQAEAEPVEQMLRLREVNALFGAMTAALVFAIGWKLRGIIAACAGSLLFAFDPYIQRINRRNMLETSATALALLGVWLYMDSIKRRRWLPYALGAGLAFGLAGLTKEFMFVGPVALLIFAVVLSRDQLPRATVVGVTAAGVYSIYPTWLISQGAWPEYSAMKSSQLTRIVSKLQISTPSSAPAALPSSTVSSTRVSLWENLVAVAQPYIFSYLLIAVGGLLIVWLAYRRLPWSRRHPDRNLLILALWAALNFVIVGSSMVIGNGSDQFFYYLIVPSTILVGWGIATITEHATVEQRPIVAGRSRPSRGATVATRLLSVVLGLALLWNLSVYIRIFALADDDGYAELARYVARTIPPGSTLVAGSDVANYVFDDYIVRFDRQPADFWVRGTRYVIVSTKDRWGGYNDVTPAYYDWVIEHGTPLFVHEGPTHWRLTLLEITLPEQQDEQDSLGG